MTLFVNGKPTRSVEWKAGSEKAPARIGLGGRLAWLQLTDQQRTAVTEILKKHPHYGTG